METIVRSHTESPEERCWYDLMLAVVQVACEDYKTYRKMQLTSDSAMVGNKIRQLQMFFNSPYFEKITNIADVKGFVRALDAQVMRQ